MCVASAAIFDPDAALLVGRGWVAGVVEGGDELFEIGVADMGHGVAVVLLDKRTDGADEAASFGGDDDSDGASVLCASLAFGEGCCFESLDEPGGVRGGEDELICEDADGDALWRVAVDDAERVVEGERELMRLEKSLEWRGEVEVGAGDIEECFFLEAGEVGGLADLLGE